MRGRKKAGLPLDPLADLLDWWRKAGVRGMIIGGLAVGLHGRPRVTRDVDAVVEIKEAEWPAFLKIGKGFHFTPRIPSALEFARESRVLLLRHLPSRIDIDLSVAGLPFELEALDRSSYVTVRRRKIPLATVEDLIIFKAVAQRPQDLADIGSLLELHPALDHQRVRRWLAEFAQLLEAPNLYLAVEQMLKSHRRRP